MRVLRSFPLGRNFLSLVCLVVLVCLVAPQLEVTLTKKSPADWPELEGTATPAARPAAAVTNNPDASSASTAEAAAAVPAEEPPTKVPRPYSSTKNWDVVSFLAVLRALAFFAFERRDARIVPGIDHHGHNWPKLRVVDDTFNSCVETVGIARLWPRSEALRPLCLTRLIFSYCRSKRRCRRSWIPKSPKGSRP